MTHYSCEEVSGAHDTFHLLSYESIHEYSTRSPNMFFPTDVLMVLTLQPQWSILSYWSPSNTTPNPLSNYLLNAMLPRLHSFPFQQHLQLR